MAKLNFVILALLLSASELGAEEAIPLEGNFSAQVNAIMEDRLLTSEDFDVIYEAVNDIERLLQTRWPEAKVIPFGSLKSGLGTPDSDIDCYIIISHPTNTTTAETAALLKQYPGLFADVYQNGKKTPKVSGVHLPSRRDFDLSFTGPSGLRNTKLMNYLLHRDSAVFKLAVIVKYWEKIQELDKKVSHYIFTLMVIFFLQQKGVLPPVAKLQKNVEPLMVENWNTAFEERQESSNEDLFNLLVEFFNYYSHFEYERDVISPYVGHPVKKASFEDITRLPEELWLYKHNVLNNITAPIDLSSPIAIQESFEHNRNVAIKIGNQLTEKLKAAIRSAYDKYLSNMDPDEFLKSILRV